MENKETIRVPRTTLQGGALTGMTPSATGEMPLVMFFD